MREIAVPIVIARAPMRTVRPSGLTQRWAQPAKELKRLRDNGVIRRLAHGHYIAPPDGAVARDWRPDLETAAMALATARYGDRVPVLMGMGAARFHRAVPRAFDRTVVAVPEQAHRVDLDDELGRVVFATRDTALLDARLEEFGIGRALVATPEQTVLDVVIARSGVEAMMWPQRRFGHCGRAWIECASIDSPCVRGVWQHEIGPYAWRRENR